MMKRNIGRLTSRYVLDLEPVTYAYRTTTMQLMIRGFGFTDAKRMVRISGLLDAVEEVGVLWYHDMDIEDCADFVEKAMNDMKRITVDWTGIIFERG
ncbi:MAG: hypothetical protein J6I74_06145 [Schwartzia sp.]|nr:hypothetical protein [Schwartzia sp. (in: firmicutes)]